MNLLKSYFEQIEKNCAIIIENQNVDINEILHYVGGLVKYMNVNTFFFDSFGKIERKILEMINCLKNTTIFPLKTVLLKNSKDKNTYSHIFDEIYSIEQKGSNKNFVLSYFGYYTILTTQSFKSDIYNFCSNGFKVVKVF